MITPEQYEIWPESLVELIQQLEDYIISDICRRLKKEDWSRFTSTAYQQAGRLIEFDGLDIAGIIRKISEITMMMQSDIEELLQKTFDSAQKDVGYVYERLGVSSNLEDSAEIQQVLRAQSRQTGDEFKNITGSMGFAYKDGGTIRFKPIAYAYQDSLDYVQMQIVSGAVSPDTAIKNAVKRLTDSGVRTIDYASGRSNQVDVAVRRATVTGMTQVTGYISEAQAEELDTDLVEVSAHGGARDTGSGFKNHKSWQGKIYSLSGLSKKYPSLKEATGYGNVAGLKGANCRHDFSPFVDGVMQRRWDDDALKKIDKPPFVFEGHRYTAYEATQRQRQMETVMRATKRRLIGYKNAGLMDDFNASAALLAQQRETYLNFSRAAGLRPQTERAQIYRFNQRISQKAVQANKRIERFKSELIGKTTSTGIPIKDISPHLVARAHERNISKDNVVDALTSPLKTGSIRNDNSQQFIGAHATVVVNRKTGKVISAWETSKKKANKLKGGG